MDTGIPYELPNGWIWSRLGDLFNITSGGTPDRGNATYYNGDIPWIKSGELNYNVITTSEELITDKGLQDSSAKIFPAGTVLIALYGATVGKLAILGIPAATNQAVAGIMTSTPINRYLYYYLLSTRRQLLEQRQGAAQPNISQKILKDFLIPIPPYNQLQSVVEKIEELFSELEKNIELLKTSIEQIKVYQKSILQYAFEGRMTEQWRPSQDQSENKNTVLAKIREYRKNNYGQKLTLPNDSITSDLPMLPNGWHWIRLSDVVENASIKIQPIQHPSLKFVGMDCIEPYSLQPHKFYKFSDFKSAGNYFEIDHVLYGRMRPNLNKVWKAEFEGACSGEFIVLKSFEYLLPDYLKYNLHSARFVSFASQRASGDRPRISFDEMGEFLLPLCPIEEQAAIVENIDVQLSHLKNLEEAINSILLQSESSKQALLQKAFRGELVERNLNDEPVNALLEKMEKERKLFLDIERERKIIEKKSNEIMAEELKQIIDILKQDKNAIPAKLLWQRSPFKDDIEGFYAELKKLIESDQIVELPRKGKESLIKLKQ